MKGFFKELRRRHVFRVSIAYLVVAWLVVQLVNNIVGPLHLPEWTATLVIVLLAIGFPIAVILAWAFEVTPEGVKRAAIAPKKSTLLSGSRAETPAAVSAAPSIAVLPFADMSPDKDQEYFADGMTEEILNSLVRVRDLQVTGRTSSFHFKGKNEDIRTIAEKLGVQNVLEGSVRKSGDQVRITAQLISARNGYHLWSKTYDRKLEDIFAIQDEIARAVADALEVTLGVGDLGRIEGGTKNAEAYSDYLHGRALSRERTPEAVSRAIDHFERAIERDRSFALPWAGLFDAYDFMAGTDSKVHADVWAGKRRAALGRARELAPEAPGVLVATAVDYMSRRQWIDAERVFQSAIARDLKTLAEIDYRYGFFLLSVGRASEALDYARRHLRAEPLDPYAYMLLGMAYAAGGTLDEALAEYKRGISRIGGSVVWLRGTALTLALATGNRALIEERLEAVIDADPVGRAVNEKMRSLLDDSAAALAELRRMFKDPAFRSLLQRFVIARWAAYFGDTTLSLDALNTSLRDFLEVVPNWTQPLFREVRKTPGFRDFVREMGLVDYWRESGYWGDFCHPVGDDDFECE